MDLGIIAISVMMMTGLGVVLSVTLAIANRKLQVFEDPRIDTVEGLLPGANCGACGLPGCRNFAEQVVLGKITPGKCNVCAPELREEIAGMLGVAVGAETKRVARLACAGGTNVARQRAQYEGMMNCRSAQLVAGGGKGCAWGCLGLSDCAIVCSYGAISMNEFSIPVIDQEKCTACGDCVEICPRQLFAIHPIDHCLWVACKNEAFADLAEQECEVACTSCGRCAADSTERMVTMKNNLAVVDYTKNSHAHFRFIERCPTGAIVWYLEDGRAKKGKAAKRIVRKTALPIG